MSVLELADGALVEARVDDELWRGARVPLAALPQAERAWLAKVAARALAALGAAPDVRGTVRMESDGAHARVDGGPPLDLAPARADLAALLDAVQGALLIDEDATGLAVRVRGDSPA